MELLCAAASTLALMIAFNMRASRRWIQVLGVIALLSWFGVYLDCRAIGARGRESERERRAEKARLEAIDQAYWREQTEQEHRREGEAEREKVQRAALDAEERALPAPERTRRVQALLPDVCRAKELLAKTSNPNDPELAEASRAVAIAERQQLSRERPEFEKRRRLMCNDRTPSPSCMCAGKHQGCCSYHHGISGCEPYPTAVACSGI